MRRSIAAVLAVLTILNGSIMLLAAPTWYESVPGVSETGPYNPHFIQDIGAAFLSPVWRLPHAPGGPGIGPQRWPARVSWPPMPCSISR